MYTITESKLTIIKIDTYKCLTDDSLVRVVDDIKKYCDEELIVVNGKSVSKELIRSLIVNKNPDDHYINTNYIAHKLNSDYNPNYEEDEDNSEYQLVKHSRWEDDYEGEYCVWYENFETIVFNYLSNHEADYEWKVVDTKQTIVEK